MSSVFQLHPVLNVLWNASMGILVLFCVAWGGAWMMRKKSAAVRHLVWFVATGTSILFLIWPIFPTFRGAEIPSVGTLSQGMLEHVSILAKPVEPEKTPTTSNLAFDSESVPAKSVVVDSPKSDSTDWGLGILGVWILGMFFVGLRFLAGLWQVWRIYKEATPETGVNACRLKNLCQSLGIRRRVTLLISEKPVMPMTWGWWNPVVLIPLLALSWPEERLKIVMLHELAHVHRRDGLMQSIVSIAQIIFWFHPLIWIGNRQIRIEREHACDDLVLEYGVMASDYAENLLNIALEYPSRSASTMVFPMARHGQLESRLRAILDFRRGRGRVGSWMVCGILAVTFGVMCFLNGCASTQTNQAVGPLKVSQEVMHFFVEKEKEARDMNATSTNKCPNTVWDYFSALEKGDWMTASNYMYALTNNDGVIKTDSGSDPVECKHFWNSCPVKEEVRETYWTYVMLSNRNAKYYEAYARDIIKSIPEGCIYFGGSDAGRFLVSAFSKSHREGKPFFAVTQNALADNTYREYMRFLYGNQIALFDEVKVESLFNAYIIDAQKRLTENRLMEGEHVKNDRGRVEISGVGAVMLINGLMVREIFEQNTNREFYIEESWPIEWMYPFLSPHGLIMKLNHSVLNTLDETTIERDAAFWRNRVRPMIGNWLRPGTSLEEVERFVEKRHGEHDWTGFTGDKMLLLNKKASCMYASARCAIAEIYEWRANNATASNEKARYAKAADFAYRQAFALCPYWLEGDIHSIPARYIKFLAGQKRVADSHAIAQLVDKLNSNEDTREMLKRNPIP